jgi:hypothetical protein
MHRLLSRGAAVALTALAFTLSFAQSDEAAAQDASCKLESKVRSLHSSVPSKITFINNSGMYRALLWIDFKGQAQSYGGLNPGESKNFNTFLTHPWMVATGPGDCIQIVQPLPGDMVVNLGRGMGPASGELPGTRLKGCPPGTRPVPQTDNCIPVGASLSNEAEFLGTWRQTSSSGGECRTCSIHFSSGPRGALNVRSNNGWSATVTPSRNDPDHYSGSGRWGSVGGPFAGKSFQIEFRHTRRTLSMIMRIHDRGRDPIVHASFVP